MSARIGINGFGRMGRLSLRVGWNSADVEWVRINEINMDAAGGAHLLNFDSVQGRWNAEAAGKDDTVVIEDGEELSRKYHRHALSPDAVITGEHTEVQAVCNAVWTDEVKAAYETFKANQEI